ncbi:pyridoxal-phosphate dependent enzyme [Burkholderia cepacia]|uniref:pyridoxal-phosphate dependent enzyme n=1 Tax=Burkholderia cepacia TaxID=292 RepID=UPI00075FED6A|nr:pyridoxal-phosphate dependent enzyme [Burkholderia cepacia]
MHYGTTGPEIREATDGRIDGFVDFVCSDGSFVGVGVGKALKERNFAVRCYAVEPVGAVPIAG